LLVVVFALSAIGAIGVTGSSATAATAAPEPSPDLSVSVVGGRPVANFEFPSLAAIMVNIPDVPARDRLVCTGTVITRRWILTAGHCSQALLFGPSVQVQIGNPSLGAAGAITVRVNRGIVHRAWYKRGVGYDVALFHLQEDVNVPFSRLAVAADLPLLAEGAVGTIVGWGLTQRLGIQEPPDINARIPVRARVADVPIVGDDACAEVFRDVAPHYFVPASDLCAGSEGHNVCYGDSGGPIYAMDPQGQLVQIGITSRGAGCATKHFPSIFTDVRRLHGWIHRYTTHPCPTRVEFPEDPEFPTGPLYVC
jgi:secreted trypsin-like serine protease